VDTYLLVPELKQPAVVDAFGARRSIRCGHSSIYSAAVVSGVDPSGGTTLQRHSLDAITAEINENWQAKGAYLFYYVDRTEVGAIPLAVGDRVGVGAGGTCPILLVYVVSRH